MQDILDNVKQEVEDMPIVKSYEKEIRESETIPTKGDKLSRLNEIEVGVRKEILRNQNEKELAHKRKDFAEEAVYETRIGAFRRLLKRIDRMREELM